MGVLRSFVVVFSIDIEDMIYLLKSGEWYRVGHSVSRYVVDTSDNPALELLGQVAGGQVDSRRWSLRMKKVCDDVRGDWYLLRDEDFVDSLVSSFDGGGSDCSPGGIEGRYDVSSRIVRVYAQMSSWLSSNPDIVDESSSWRSRLLGQCESLRALGSSVFRGYSSGSTGFDVRYHDGRVWSAVTDTELRVSLQYFCLDDLGVGAGEWVRNERKYLAAVRDGATMNPLEMSRSVIGFQNGVYDFSDASSPVYHPFSDRLPVVDLLPYEYDVKATCPLWVSFLASILSEGQVELLRRYFGLALADRRTLPYKVERSLWLVGPGGAGKSTIMNVIRHVVGASRVSSVSLGALLSGNPENRARFMAAVDGKVFNYCGEVQMDDMTKGSDTFKSICSGEPQMMRRIGGNVEMTSDVPYLVFNMNRKPRNRVIDDALMRRLLFVVFPTAVRECDRDPQLETKLKGEASGILNWMLEGFRHFVADGGVLSPTGVGEEEGERWMTENEQSVEAFMRSSGYRSFGYTGEMEKGIFVSVKTLYDEYFKWCSKHGIDPDVDLPGMGRELRRAGFRPRRSAKGMEYRIYIDKVTNV